MESKKDIGKAFREKLDQLHRQPGDAVWDAIKNDLNKKKHKAIPVWLRLWTIAGIFLIIAFFTYPFWKNNVPHIYIKMPEQETEQVTNKTSKESKPANYSNGSTIAEDENGESSDGNINEPIKSTNLTVETSETVAGLPSANASSSQDALPANNSSNRSTIYSKQQPDGKNNRSRTGNTIDGTSQRSTTITGARNTSRPQEVAENTLNKGNNNRSAKRNSQNKKDNSIVSKNEITGNDRTKNNNPKNSADEDTDEGFIVPMSAAYKSYRNNTARPMPADTIVKDSTETEVKRDFSKVTDSLRKLSSTGVHDVLKVPDTKPGYETGNGFYIYGFAAPTKYTFSENGGYIDTALQGKGTSSKGSLVYGAYIGYNISPKLGIRIGTIKAKTELETNNVSVAGPDFKGIEYNQGISNESIAGQMNEDPEATLNIRNNYEFIEVPLELTYNLYQSQIGISVLGGFITRFTTDNSVFAQNATGSMEIGKMKDLKDVNNGISLGGSFNYKILPNLQLNVEPVYKYFFNKDGFIKQHTYSIQAGLQFNFGPGKQK